MTCILFVALGGPWETQRFACEPTAGSDSEQRVIYREPLGVIQYSKNTTITDGKMPNDNRIPRTLPENWVLEVVQQ